MQSKTVFITGSSSGIGKALARKFNAEGFFVFLASRNVKDLKILQNELKFAENSKIIEFDVRNYAQVFSQIKSLSENFSIDYLINNAGITVFKSVENTSINEIDDILLTNLNGVIYTTKAILPIMLEKQSGTIVNILSIAAEKIYTESSVYSASKAGLLAFGNVLREEVRNQNIRVINVLPAAVATPIWHPKSLEKSGKKMMKTEDLAEFIFINLVENSVVAEEITFRSIYGI
jgi:3-oxoacyl-[acyl-carrier protein] reductase